MVDVAHVGLSDAHANASSATTLRRRPKPAHRYLSGCPILVLHARCGWTARQSLCQRAARRCAAPGLRRHVDMVEPAAGSASARPAGRRARHCDGVIRSVRRAEARVAMASAARRRTPRRCRRRTAASRCGDRRDRAAAGSRARCASRGSRDGNCGPTPKWSALVDGEQRDLHARELGHEALVAVEALRVPRRAGGARGGESVGDVATSANERLSRCVPREHRARERVDLILHVRVAAVRRRRSRRRAAAPAADSRGSCPSPWGTRRGHCAPLAGLR